MNKREELKAMIEGVDRMADAMKRKLRMKARKDYSGGLDPDYKQNVARKLHEHTEELVGSCPICGKGTDGDAAQAVDVCNLALMLWLQGEGNDRSA